MPTYGYRCKSCLHEFEEFQKVSEDLLIVCPKCSQDTLVRIIGGGAGLVFKGSGFYLTDYKKSSATSASKPEASKGTEPSPDSSGQKPSEPASSSGGD